MRMQKLICTLYMYIYICDICIHNQVITYIDLNEYLHILITFEGAVAVGWGRAGWSRGAVGARDGGPLPPLKCDQHGSLVN